jgi:peroxiredoxin Q/BCP
MSLKPGDRAPKLQGPDFKLSAMKGQRVVVFFFPKADTPGCTRESCAFSEMSAKFKKKNTAIVGVSPDESESQAKFTDKYGLKIPFVPDPDHSIAEAYGVWKEKKNYGRTYMGIERTTFIVDEAGKIAKTFPKVRVDGHAEKVLAALDEE